MTFSYVPHLHNMKQSRLRQLACAIIRINPPMPSEPFTLRIVFPYGNPEGVRIIDDPSWPGKGIVFPRNEWPAAQAERSELTGAGIYILAGQDDDLPPIYVGQTDRVGSRLDDHHKNKEFWDQAIAFVCAELNRAHITWLEAVLIRDARKTGRCRLENGNDPREPALGQADRIFANNFLNKIKQILPLAGLPIFQPPRKIKPATTDDTDAAATAEEEIADTNTIVVAADAENFEKLFIAENCWRSIRIAGGRLEKIRYIAVYRTAPVSAITHYAEVAQIESYGTEGKYKVLFAGTAREIGPIDKDSAAVQGPRYTTLAKLQAAKTLADL